MITKPLPRPLRIGISLLRAPLERYCVSKLPRKGKPAPKTGRLFQIISALEFRLRKLNETPTKRAA